MIDIISELDPLFYPEGVAVVGASKSPAKIGTTTLLSIVSGGFEGKIYPINPKGGKILGLKAYSSLNDISDDIDLIIVCVPAVNVPEVIEDSVEIGARVGVIISSGFSEVGENGMKLEKEVVRIARKGGMRIVGPNCMGVCNTTKKLYALINMIRTIPGDVSMVSQSGTFGTIGMKVLSNHSVGVNKFVSSGNEADIHTEDLIEYYSQDADTKVIFAFIEGIRDGRKFIEVSKEATKKKLFVVLKGGTTDAGTKAVSSHTGALAGSDTIYDAVFAQTGIIRAVDCRGVIDLLKAFSMLPLPKGKRVGILTAGGGAGVLTADACEKEGLEVPDLPKEIIEELNRFLPPFWSHGNPIDITASGFQLGLSAITVCLEALLQCEKIDSVICRAPIFSYIIDDVFTRASLSKSDLKSMPWRTMDRRSIEKFIELKEKYEKTLISMDLLGNRWSEGVKLLEENGIPVYETPEQTAYVSSKLLKYREYLDSRG
jgi:acyl-CoA synthetase (NDP forming)